MRSDARKRLATTFADLVVGQRCQLVNSVMGATIPGTKSFEKIVHDENDNNAVCIESGERLRIRPQNEVEIIGVIKSKLT